MPLMLALQYGGGRSNHEILISKACKEQVVLEIGSGILITRQVYFIPSLNYFRKRHLQHF